MNTFRRSKLKLILLVCLLSCFQFSAADGQDDQLSEDPASKVELSYDGISVEIPLELKAIRLTIETPALDPSRRNKKRTSTIKIVDTAFWNSTEESINMSEPFHVIQLESLLKPIELRGRVLDRMTQRGLGEVQVEVSSENNKLYAQTYTTNDGFFTVSFWINKGSKKLKVNFLKSGYATENIEIPPSQRIIGPVVMRSEADQEQLNRRDGASRKYYMIAARAEDALGTPLEKLDIELEFVLESGTTTKLKMLEKDGLYSVLVDSSVVTQVPECKVSVHDRKEKWSPFIQQVDCSEPRFIRIPMIREGETESFASGSVVMNKPSECQVWLVRVLDASNYEVSEIRAGGDEGKFDFSFREGMERSTYRLAVTFSPPPGVNMTPLWIADQQFSPRPLGGGDQYSLGRKIELKIPDNYLAVFPYLATVQSGGTQKLARIIPQYDNETRQMLVQIETSLQKSGKFPALALNIAKSFEVSLAGDATSKIVINENQFLQGNGQSIALTHKGATVPLVVSAFPVGKSSTVKDMKRVMADAVDSLITHPSIRGQNLTLICGEWVSTTNNWSQKRADLESVRVIPLPRSADFARDLQRYLFDGLQTENIPPASKINAVLLVDDAFLNACQDESFDPTNLKTPNLGNVAIIVFSDSYMGDQADYQPLINKLKQAFTTVTENIDVQIVSPLDALDLTQVIAGSVLAITPKEYSWIPIEALRRTQSDQTEPK
jgi:hypothetical protein